MKLKHYIRKLNRNTYSDFISMKNKKCKCGKKVEYIIVEYRHFNIIEYVCPECRWEWIANNET